MGFRGAVACQLIGKTTGFDFTSWLFELGKLIGTFISSETIKYNQGKVPGCRQNSGGTMFASLKRKEIAIRAVLVAAILFNALASNPVLAQSESAVERKSGMCQ